MLYPSVRVVVSASCLKLWIQEKEESKPSAFL